MATDVCCTSPRFSFSSAGEGMHTDAPPCSLDPSPIHEFNFMIGGQSSSDQTPSADELFSNGKILPLFKPQTPSAPVSVLAPTPTAPTPAPPLSDRRNSLREVIDSSAADSDARFSSRLSIWRIHRSSSVGEVNDPGAHLNPFYLYRSRSTGSYPIASPTSKQSRQQAASEWNQRKTYYYSGSQRGSVSRGSGVRISPVLNVPAPVVSRGSSGRSNSSGGGATTGGLFAYLLCNCGGEAEDEREDWWLNEAEQVRGKK